MIHIVSLIWGRGGFEKGPLGPCSASLSRECVLSVTRGVCWVTKVGNRAIELQNDSVAGCLSDIVMTINPFLMTCNYSREASGWTGPVGIF